ncbi:hypothetical protein ACFE04_016416 [Oxalis oulophora]
MSNNAASQPLTIPSSQMSQPETVSGPMLMRPGVNEFTFQPFPMLSTQIGVSSTNNGLYQQPDIRMRLPMSNNPGFHNFPVSNINTGQMDTESFNIVNQQILLNQQPLKVDSMPNNIRSQQLYIPNKRKSPMEMESCITTMPNKRVDQMENRPRMQQAALGHKTNLTQSEPLGTQNVKAQKKKLMRTEPMAKKPGPVPKSRKTQIQPSPKDQMDLSEIVRSKMREQLAAALDLETQQQEKPQNQDLTGKSNGILSSKVETCTDVGSGESTQFPTFDGFEFQSTIDDISFTDGLFVSDELLEGNGLSWVLDYDEQAAEIQTAPKQEFKSPQILASKIEAELFKQFGGVNRKYKEKGRSLLFNLKDRNNPELREKVMSGEIPPDRLCAMTAEELASKELSEWRQAKAEELASMIVLPDSEIDLKRLVRKTHKGEFQVEYEEDDITGVDVSAGSSVIIRRQEKETKTKFQDSGDVTIEDTMSEIVVSDSLKDFPPAPSLDEFMISLATEPPFVNLADAGMSTPTPENGGSQEQSLDVNRKNPIDIAIKNEISNKESKSIAVPDEVGNADESKSFADTKPLHQQNPIDIAIKTESSNEKSKPFAVPDEVGNTDESKSVPDTKPADSSAKVESSPSVGMPKGEQESSTNEEREYMREVAASYICNERLGYAEPVDGVELFLCPPHSKSLDILCEILLKDVADSLNSINDGLIGVTVWKKHHLCPPKYFNTRFVKRQLSKSSSSRRQTKVSSNIIPKPPLAGRHARLPSPTPEDNDVDDDLPPGFGPGSKRDDDDVDSLPDYDFSELGGSTGLCLPNQSVFISPPTNFHFHAQANPHPVAVDHHRELILKYGQSDNTDQSPTNWLGNRGNGFLPQNPWNNFDDNNIRGWQPQMGNQWTAQHQHHQAYMYPIAPHQQQHIQPRANVVTQGQQQRAGWAPPPPGYAGQINGGAPPPPGYAVAGQPAWHQNAPTSRRF